MLFSFDTGLKFYEHVVSPVDLAERMNKSRANVFPILTTFTKTICDIKLYEARSGVCLRILLIKFRQSTPSPSRTEFFPKCLITHQKRSSSPHLPEPCDFVPNLNKAKSGIIKVSRAHDCYTFRS